MGFAVFGENTADGLAGPFFNDMIHIDEFHVELMSELFADGRFTRAHEAHEDDVRGGGGNG